MDVYLKVQNIAGHTFANRVSVCTIGHRQGACTCSHVLDQRHNKPKKVAPEEMLHPELTANKVKNDVVNQGTVANLQTSVIPFLGPEHHKLSQNERHLQYMQTRTSSPTGRNSISCVKAELYLPRDNKQFSDHSILKSTNTVVQRFLHLTDMNIVTGSINTTPLMRV